MKIEEEMKIPLVNRIWQDESDITRWEETVYGGKPALESSVSGLFSPLFPGDIRTVGLQFGADYATIFYTDQKLGKSRKEAMLILNMVNGKVLPSYSLKYPGLYICLGYEPKRHGPPQFKARVKCG